MKTKDKKLTLPSRFFPLSVNLFFPLLVTLATIYIAWPSLNPFTPYMFDFHDETQLGRITSFVANLKAGNIPPRLAPEFSFNMGFPLFNFYAPFAYFVTSGMVLLGISPISALKASFLLAMVLAGLGTYLLCRQWFSASSSAVGAILFTSSTYWATEIVIRGNLAEVWFLAALPFALLMLYKLSQSYYPLLFITTSLVLSFLFSVHNIFSLVSVAVVVVFAFLLPNVKRLLLAILLGFGMALYFILPALLEVGHTQARELAKYFFYTDHFLCAWQLWAAKGWHFGGSYTGCDADLMSFKLGKLQLMLGLGGALFVFYAVWVKKAKKTPTLKSLLFIAVLTLLSLYLTLYQSAWFWKLLEPLMSLFQFPWRFLAVAMFGLGIMGAYFINLFPTRFFMQTITALILIALLTIPAQKYFIKPLIDAPGYDNRYNSAHYRQKIIAYNTKEYLAKGADFEYWRLLNPLEVENKPLPFDHNRPIEADMPHNVVFNTPFYKKVELAAGGNAYVNLHAFPYWHISFNGKKITPLKHDILARPYFTFPTPGTLIIEYRQTPLEKTSNALSIISFVAAIALAYRLKPKTV